MYEHSCHVFVCLGISIEYCFSLFLAVFFFYCKALQLSIALVFNLGGGFFFTVKQLISLFYKFMSKVHVLKFTLSHYHASLTKWAK